MQHTTQHGTTDEEGGREGSSYTITQDPHTDGWTHARTNGRKCMHVNTLQGGRTDVRTND